MGEGRRGHGRIDWEERRKGKQQKGCKINKYILENETLYIITHTPLKIIVFQNIKSKNTLAANFKF